jgi:hypothetical protein
LIAAKKGISVSSIIIARGTIIAMALILSNCASLIAKKNTYAAAGPSAKVNGAAVRMQVNPQGTANGAMAFSAMVVSTAVATMEGPFRWRIEATGTSGEHQSLQVHRIHTSTEKSGRNEWYPTEKLPRAVAFKADRENPSVTYARYEIPGLLQVTSANDGILRVTADVTITSSKGRERKTVRFLLDPAQKRADEFIFLPVEIVKTFGKSWEEIENPSWD